MTRAMLVASLALLPASVADAQGSLPPTVAIDVTSCPAASATVVERIVGIELRVVVTSVTAPDVTSVRVTCEGPVLHIRVDDPITGKALERRYEIGRRDVRSLPRTVALAAVELVTASWSELELDRPPVTPDDVPPAAAAVGEDVRASAREVVRAVIGPSRREWTLVGFGTVRAQIPAPSWGGGVRVAYAPLEWLELALDVTFSQGRASTSLGDVRADLLDAGVLLALAASLGPLTFRGGLGARAGGAWLVGEPSRDAAVAADTVGGVWAGALVALGADVEPVPGLVIDLRAEGGITAQGVRAQVEGEGAVTIARGDLWLGGSLGVGARL